MALLLGALVAAPLAAWTVSRLDHHVLGALVGGMILFYNAPNVLGIVGIEGDAVLLARIAIVAVTLVIVGVAWRQRRIDRATATAAESARVEPRSPAMIPVDVAGDPGRHGTGALGRRESADVRAPVLVTVDEEP